MNRLLSAALLSSVLVQAPLAHAAESEDCSPAVLATLGRALKVAHFAPGPDDDGKDPAGVVLVSSCKRMPDDPRLTLAAVGWDAHQQDTKSLVVAIVDEAASAVVAQHLDEISEDATTQVHEGVLRLDTAPLRPRARRARLRRRLRQRQPRLRRRRHRPVAHALCARGQDAAPRCCRISR